VQGAFSFKEVAMRKKVVAFISILAILSLSAPGLFALEKFDPYYHFDNFLKKPIMILYSFLYFTPIYDTGKYIAPPTQDNPLKRIKTTGGLDIDRPSEGD
jgi:hypothetical protein